MLIFFSLFSASALVPVSREAQRHRHSRLVFTFSSEKEELECRKPNIIGNYYGSTMWNWSQRRVSRNDLLSFILYIIQIVYPPPQHVYPCIGFGFKNQYLSSMHIATYVSQHFSQIIGNFRIFLVSYSYLRQFQSRAFYPSESRLHFYRFACELREL